MNEPTSNSEPVAAPGLPPVTPPDVATGGPPPKRQLRWWAYVLIALSCLVLLAVTAVVLTVPFTMWLGKVLDVEPALSQLIGTGTGICGASAIIAANQVVRGKQEDVTYALAVITLCGTAALVIYPALSPLLGLSARSYGLWAGSSIHEVVQAVGAAAAGGPLATEVGTITKLARVIMLAPAVLALGLWVRRGQPKDAVKAPVPWFAFGFLALIVIGSTGVVPRFAVDASLYLVPLMLAASAELPNPGDFKTIEAVGVPVLITRGQDGVARAMINACTH